MKAAFAVALPTLMFTHSRMIRMLAGVGCAVALTTSAAAQENRILPVEPPSWTLGDVELTAGGLAGGALSYVWQEGGPAWSTEDRVEASGLLRSWLRAQRVF